MTCSVLVVDDDVLVRDVVSRFLGAPATTSRSPGTVRKRCMRPS
ncbi:MAG TPA: hypothetical protein VJS67_07000 [Pseudonocardiaceae bacterium]|nr:hypothetical protein [Pseudonocardiaceae bacterium]